MKIKEIENLNTQEFIKLLNEDTFEYVRDAFEYDWQALELYQNGADSCGLDCEDEYMEVNEYFEAIKEQKEEQREEEQREQEEMQREETDD